MMVVWSRTLINGVGRKDWPEKIRKVELTRLDLGTG